MVSLPPCDLVLVTMPTGLAPGQKLRSCTVRASATASVRSALVANAMTPVPAPCRGAPRRRLATSRSPACRPDALPKGGTGDWQVQVEPLPEVHVRKLRV